MKRCLVTLLVFAVATAVVRADVTVVQKTTVEGGMAAMAPGSVPTPTMTMRVKGMRSRTELEAGAMSVITIVDLTTKQVIVLRPDQKTASITTAAAATTTSTTATTTATTTVGTVDASIKPTGKSQVIDGIKCDEYTFTTSMDMSSMSGPQMPPEAVAMMQGMKMMMAGSMWVSKDVPGAKEYLAFQKASAASNMLAAASGASGVNIPGMDKVMKAMGSVEGMSYLTEMTMTIDGTGQIADMMKQMGAMKMTTRTTSVNTDTVSDDLFKVPEGYTITK